MNKERAIAAQSDPRGECDHICLKDREHLERGEPHFYGYENPSPRQQRDHARWDRDTLDALAWGVYDDGGFSDDPDSRYIVIKALSTFVTALLAAQADEVHEHEWDEWRNVAVPSAFDVPTQVRRCACGAFDVREVADEVETPPAAIDALEQDRGPVAWTETWDKQPRTTCPNCRGTGNAEDIPGVMACQTCHAQGWVHVAVEAGGARLSQGDE